VADAVVIGAGPNGLVAANLLADAGWSVEVLEAQLQPGGAVKSAELAEPGFVTDVFSAFYPLAAASPVLRRLQLERFGLRFRHGPLVLAHPAADGTCPVLARDLAATAAALDELEPGDGDGWRELMRWWERAGDALLDGLVTPFPPVRAGVRLAAGLRGDLPELARLALLPARRLGNEHFRGDAAKRLLVGNALHADLLPESAGSGFIGWVLMALGQTVGYPCVEGGAGALTRALVRRLEAAGGSVRCGTPVERVLVRRGRATGVRLAGGEEVGVRRAVLADVHVLHLYGDLVDPNDLPSGTVERLRHVELDHATLKVDWSLDGPIPWASELARRAPVVHVADSVDELSATAGELARGLLPERPFLVLGQYGPADPTRAPAGKETAWAYTHLPQALDVTDAVRDELVDRIEARIEALAPGFRRLVRRRHVLTPQGLEERDANLVGGSLNGGTAQLHQQLILRPLPGLARPETPVRGLYLCSASAHPGGGVHGGPGAIAASAALRKERARRVALAVGAGAALVALRRSRGTRASAA
jgi:phytoene dehydrogenase-like protein